MEKLLDNQLSLENLGSASGLQPFPGNNSSPREQMFTSQVGQILVVRGADERFLQTGAESQYGTCTFNVAMPCNGVITRVIPKYNTGQFPGAFRYNPLKVAIYEAWDDENKGLVGTVRIDRFHASHQSFGFMYNEVMENQRMLRPGQGIEAGTVFCQSPNITPSKGYGFGVNANVTFLSVAAVDNDGVIMSDSMIPKLTSTGVISTSGKWGRKNYPLNLYGTKTEYKPFPGVGDKIRADGLLFALRTYDDMCSVTEMTPEALMEVDYIWDTCYYGKPNGEVVDITVHHPQSRIEPTPVGMDAQARTYLQNQEIFYAHIRQTYTDLKKKYGQHLKLTPEFQNLMVRALAEDPNQPGFVVKTLHKSPLDDWQIQLTFTYDVVPSVGSKVTDCHGGKGVVVEIRRWQDMPVDDYGNRSDFIMDPDSTINRMNIGRNWEQGTNWTSSMVLRDIRQMQELNSQTFYDDAWSLLMRYYEAVSNRHFALMSKHYDSVADRRAHIDYVLKFTSGIHLHMPPDRSDAGAPSYRRILREFPYPKTPVTFVNGSGRKVRTKANVMVGSMYIILLEKTGEDWSAVSSPKLQHFGIPAMITQDDKYSTPGREQPVKFTGESESRLFQAVMGGEASADILDMPNMPGGQKLIVKAILLAENQSDIKQVLDRNLCPPGSNRALQIIKHMLQCGGVTLSKEL